MTKIKIKDNTFPALIFGVANDKDWDGRESKTIKCEMTYEEAKDTFVDNLSWAILYQPPEFEGDDGIMVIPPVEEYDNSDYCVSGPITDNRDGTVSVKMGKKTDGEMLEELKEAINRGV